MAGTRIVSEPQRIVMYARAIVTIVPEICRMETWESFIETSW